MPIVTSLAAEAELKARRLAGMTSLATFLRDSWHVNEPSTPLRWSWHLDALCTILEAMLFGRLRELLIVIPPNTTKSRTVSVAFPAFDWLLFPHLRFLFISNSDENAERDSMACRRIIQSDWYQNTFRPQWGFQNDKNQTSWYETTLGGHRNCAGIGSRVTGKKGHFVLVDDANDAEEVHSEAERTKINRKFDNAIWDRVNDFKTGCRLAVGQRTHVSDLIGHIKKTYQWQECYIPEEYNPAKRGRVYDLAGKIIWQDPRTHKGQLLREWEMTPALVADYKRTRATVFRTKHNGDPRNDDGTRFKRDNLRYWRRDGDWIVLPAHIKNGKIERDERRFQASQALHLFGTCDGAASAKSSADFTVMSSWMVSPWNDLLWIGCKRFRAEIPEQPAILLSEARRWGLEFVGVESVASNTALFQLANREAVVIRPLSPRKLDKLARAVPAIFFTESFRLFLPDTGEVPDFPVKEVVDELVDFTGNEKLDEHDDVVDTLSYAVRWLTSEHPEDEAKVTDRMTAGGIDAGYGPAPAAATGRTVLDPHTVKPGFPGRRSEEIQFPEFRR